MTKLYCIQCDYIASEFRDRLTVALEILCCLQYNPTSAVSAEGYPIARLAMVNMFPKLIARDSSDDGLSPPMVDLLIALLVLVFLGLVLVAGLLVLRRKRQNRKLSDLPIHNGECVPSHQRRLTISTSPGAKTESVLVYDEKRSLMEEPPTPTNNAVPEIRITFPEEEDEAGKRKSGRMVVVRISDTGGVGLEPCTDELPPYQSSDAERFHSLDLERMGGLKEKQDLNRWS